MDNLTRTEIVNELTRLLELIKLYHGYTDGTMPYLCLLINKGFKVWLIRPTKDNQFAKHTETKWYNHNYHWSSAWWVRSTDGKHVHEIIKLKEDYLIDLIDYYNKLTTT